MSIDTNCAQEVRQGKLLRRLSTQAASLTSSLVTSTGVSAPVYLCPRYSSTAVPAICTPSAMMAEDASAPPTATPLGASLSVSGGAGALHKSTPERRGVTATGSGRAHGRLSTDAWWSADDGQAISAAARHNVWRIDGRATAVQTILKRGTILRYRRLPRRGGMLRSDAVKV